MIANATLPAGSGRWRLIVLSLAVLGATLGIAGYGVFFRGKAGPDPPAPDLSGVDGEVRAAIEGAREEVKRSPRSARAWGRLGMVLTSHIFGTEALACFTRAEQLEPANPRWPYHQGLIHLAHDPPAGVPKIRRAVDLCADATDGPRLRLAELYLALGQTDEAREQFQVLVRFRPRHPRAHLGLARLEVQAGRLAAARAHLDHALGHHLTRKPALALSAELYQRQGDDEAARRERARTVDLPDAPEWPDEYVEEAARLKVGESARLRLAGQLLDRKRTAEAVGVLHEAVQKYPRSAQGWTLLGWALLEQRELSAADQALQTALELDPGLARAWMYRGTIRVLQKDRRAAIACYRKAVECQPSYLHAHVNLGLCLQEEGEREAAIAAFRNALRCQPLSAPAHAHLGALLLQQGQRQDAVFHLRQAVALNPDDRRARQLLAETQRRPEPKK
jgi:tetratricopeptide (TPR) repeat protein